MEPDEGTSPTEGDEGAGQQGAGPGAPQASSAGADPTGGVSPGHEAQAAPPPSPPSPTEEAPGGLDPQLIGLCVVLWLVACGIVWSRWDGLRVDWYLGNIKETIDLEHRPDEESMTALVDLAAGGVDVVAHLRGELTGALANRDPAYRSLLVKVLERIPTDAALQLLAQTSLDLDARVRANAYVSLATRSRVGPITPEQRGGVVDLLRRALRPQYEPEPGARAAAALMLAEIPGIDETPPVREAVLWDLIRTARDERAAELAPVRSACLVPLRRLAAVAADELPFDPTAAPEVRDRQARAWEEWFRARGSTVPPGEDFASFEAALAAVQSSSTAPVPTSAPLGPPPAPGGGDGPGAPPPGAPR